MKKLLMSRTDTLRNMHPSDFEEWRERGADFRHLLTTDVMEEIMPPPNWHVNGEYGAEFGGLFPVQVRFTPPGGLYHICVCSPGEVSPSWLVVLAADAGDVVRVLLTREDFSPQRFTALLALAADIEDQNFTLKGRAAFLTEGAVL